jgi:hypothetical protein
LLSRRFQLVRIPRLKPREFEPAAYIIMTDNSNVRVLSTVNYRSVYDVIGISATTKTLYSVIIELSYTDETHDVVIWNHEQIIFYTHCP